MESQDANGNYGAFSAVFLDVIEATDGDTTTVDGTDANDLLSGGEGSDIIYARAGDDLVAGELGDDIIFGAAGDDTLRGDRNSSRTGGTIGGDDLIYGGEGN
ncbi:MAG: calcium-binding protein [Leptolyngbyaceae cyanobacterium SL_7_1]|nr:calcium-binding protein [Leptolyngbyaceae cyanobacterium SL_7_1]